MNNCCLKTFKLSELYIWHRMHDVRGKFRRIVKELQEAELQDWSKTGLSHIIHFINRSVKHVIKTFATCMSGRQTLLEMTFDIHIWMCAFYMYFCNNVIEVRLLLNHISATKYNVIENTMYICLPLMGSPYQKDLGMFLSCLLVYVANL